MKKGKEKINQRRKGKEKLIKEKKENLIKEKVESWVLNPRPRQCKHSLVPLGR